MQRRLIGAIGLAIALAVAVAIYWGGSLWGDLTALIRDTQRDLQSALAGAVRAVGRGDAGALAGLLSLCFGYGFVHAAGPGHGKVLLVGYAMANRVQTLRFAGVTLVAGLAQAGVAIALVGVVMGLLGLARAKSEGLAAEVLTPLGAVILGGLGLWLLARGALRLWRITAPAAPARGPGLATRHLKCEAAADPAPLCPDCGMSHGPDPHRVAMARGWREIALLILGVAIRPCTGALFLLAITFQLGLAGAGIAGVLAMGFGTACLNLALVLPASFARDRALRLVAPRWLAPVMAGLEVLAGILVILAAWVLASLPA